MCKGLRTEVFEELVWLNEVSEGRTVKVKEVRRGRSCRPLGPSRR